MRRETEMRDETKIYFIEAAIAGMVFVKIGVAVDPYARITTVLCGCPIPLRRVRVVSIRTRKKALQLEKRAHAFLRKFHSRGEWFSASDSEFQDLESHFSACMNMEVGLGAWEFSEIDWQEYESKKAIKKKEAILGGWTGRAVELKAKKAEFNRFRSGN